MVRTMIVAPTSNQVNKGSARCAAQPAIIVKIVTSPVHLIAGFQPFAAKPHDEYGSNRDENTPWLIGEIADIEANQRNAEYHDRFAKQGSQQKRTEGHFAQTGDDGNDHRWREWKAG